LLARCLAASVGAVRTMALESFADWRFGQVLRLSGPGWTGGASEDAESTLRGRREYISMAKRSARSGRFRTGEVGSRLPTPHA
jgi:hypothetical protein